MSPGIVRGYRRSSEAGAKARRLDATASCDATAPAPAPVLTSAGDVDARLDEALQMTFPASDPISVSAQR